MHTLALCGLGAVSRFQRHALARLADQFQVVAACDPDPATHAAIEVPTYDRLSTLLAHHRPHAVVVSVPTERHAEVTAEVLGAGLAVLVEKPAVLDLRHFDALAAAADAARVPLHTALHAAFAPDAVWMAEQRPALTARHGPVVGIRAVYHDPYHGEAGLLPRARSLGGSWVDSGVNALSAVWSLAPLTVEAVHRTFLDGVEVQSLAECRVGTGLGTIEVNWCRGHNTKHTDVCFADGACYRLEHNHHRVVRRGPDPAVLLDPRTPPPRLNQHYLEVFRDFARVLEGAPDNRALSRAIHAALLSS